MSCSILSNSALAALASASVLAALAAIASASALAALASASASVLALSASALIASPSALATYPHRNLFNFKNFYPFWNKQKYSFSEGSSKKGFQKRGDGNP